MMLVERLIFLLFIAAFVFAAQFIRPERWHWFNVLTKWTLVTGASFALMFAYLFFAYGHTPLDFAVNVQGLFVCQDVGFWDLLKNSCAGRIVSEALNGEGFRGSILGDND